SEKGKGNHSAGCSAAPPRFRLRRRRCIASPGALAHTGTMTDDKPRGLTALIGCSDEWLCRSLQSVFEEKSYVTTRSTSGKKALQLARRGDFDVLMLDQRMEDLGGADVCIALRDDPLFDHATPIVIISSAHATLQSRTEAYAAGA